MAEFLVVRIDNNPEAIANWIVVDSSGTRLTEPKHGMLEDAVADAQDRQVIGLVPGVDVLTTSVNIP